jgi:hypothetical protein
MLPVGTEVQAAGGFLCTWAVLQGISWVLNIGSISPLLSLLRSVAVLKGRPLIRNRLFGTASHTRMKTNLVGTVCTMFFHGLVTATTKNKMMAQQDECRVEVLFIPSKGYSSNYWLQQLADQCG